MKKWGIGMTAVLIAAGMVFSAFAAPVTAWGSDGKKEQKQVDIVFTHDTHSHLDGFSTLLDGKEQEVGGFARLKTLIDGKKSENPDTLVVDGGDFSMGTLVQTVYEKQASEIRMLGAIGCEVTTLGNHEFDYRSKGLSQMLKTAANSGDVLPQMVVCNVDWEAMEAAGLSEGQQQIHEGFDTYGVKDYVVLQKGDTRIAVIGVFGKDSLACAPICELLFKDPIEAVKETVAAIKEQETVDMIVCVSHSGTWEEESKSEDEQLAKAVPELDLIISGHTHTKLEEPIVHGNTYIVSAGEYGKNLGMISLVQNEKGRYDVSSYELFPVTGEVTQDIATQQKVYTFLSAVNKEYLEQFGYTSNEVLARNHIDFCSLDDLEDVHTELNLGDLMADAYVYAVTNAAGATEEPVDVAVVPSGTIRDTYTKGDITVSDVFQSFSLGIGPDGVPGYPLVSVYLTGKELKTAAEIDASVSDYMKTARLFISGLNFTYNPNRILLNKVTDVYLTGADGERIEIEDEKLYHVVADLYSGQMLSAVTDTSYGLLALVPKYKDGTPITNFEDAIITENGKELKAWDAIARYMLSFEDTNQDGIAEVPQYYAAMHDRKVVDDSKNPVELIKNPNKYAAAIVGIVAVLILLIVLIIALVVKLVKHKKKASKKK